MDAMVLTIPAISAHAPRLTAATEMVAIHAFHLIHVIRVIRVINAIRVDMDPACAILKVNLDARAVVLFKFTD